MATGLLQCGLGIYGLRRCSRSSRSRRAMLGLRCCVRLRTERMLSLRHQQAISSLCAFCWNENDALESSSGIIHGEPEDAAPSAQNSEPSLPSSPPEELGTEPECSRETPWWLRPLKVDWTKLILRSPSGEEQVWKIPWTGQTIFQVMFLWFTTFWLVGSWVIPIAAHLLGFSKETLTYRGQALYTLITDIAEGTVGIAILHRCLAEFEPLSGDWFPVKLKGRWCLEACIGCLVFPLVNRLSQINLDLLPLPNPLVASSAEQSILAKDPVATALYAIVVSVCAPVWEEVIFRGFLLPSLTKYVPLWPAIFISAVAFALAHFSLQRLLPLTFLGLLMGVVFVRNRNLLASMLLHSLWNVSVFVDLMQAS